MRFPELASRYARAHGLRNGSAEQLHVAARVVDNFGLDNALTVTADDLNRWLDCYTATVAAWTSHSKRRCVLTLLRFAADEGLRPPIGKVRPVRRPELIPTAFLLDDLRAMISAADSMRGNYRMCSIPKRLWWLSFLHAAYDTGLRLGDLLSLERDWICSSRRLYIVQSKTSQQHVVEIRPGTMALIDESMGTSPGRALIWPLWCGQDRWYGHFKRLRESAGLGAGSSKWIRRSSASYTEKAQPGCGSRHLGHRTPGLFERHYRDPRICGQEPTIPPPL